MASGPRASSGASPHVHGPACGHLAVRHEGHVDYLNHGHLEHFEGGHTEQHVVAVSDANPDRCDPKHHAAGHEAAHRHGPDCGHEAVPHGNHIDYLVDGRLHHPHGDHCDDHGPLTVVSH
jgi:hypothetical protein